MDTMGQTTATIPRSRLAAARSVGVVRAADYERAKQFYGQVLGLEVTDHGEREGRVMMGGETGFEIYENPNLSAPENTTLMFLVGAGQFDETMDELRERGVRFEDYDIPEMGIRTVNGVATQDQGKIAWFRDSEGNILALGTMQG